MNNLRQFTDGIIKIDNQRVFLTQVFYSGPVDDGIKAGVANLVYDDIFKIKEKAQVYVSVSALKKITTIVEVSLEVIIPYKIGAAPFVLRLPRATMEVIGTTKEGNNVKFNAIAQDGVYGSIVYQASGFMRDIPPQTDVPYIPFWGNH